MNGAQAYNRLNMKTFLPSALVVVSSLLLLSPAAAENSAAQPADTIFHGGTIVTVNEKQPEVSALAVKDGKIIAVGDEKEILAAHQGEGTKMVDLQGRTLMPGFVEPHVHISLTSMVEGVSLDLSNFTLPYDTIDSLLDKLRAQKEKLPEGAWIIAFGVDPARTTPLMAELNADLLDKVSTTNPTLPKPEQVVESYLQTVGRMSAVGITTSAEIALGSVIPLEKEYPMVTELSHRPDFPIRIRGYLYGTSVPKGYDAIKHNDGDDRFRVIGVKYIGDGSTQGLTAALNEPYIYPKGTTNCGKLDWNEDDLFAAMKPYFDQGWQISVHANGDRTINQALNIYDRLLEGIDDPASRRLRIEHFTVTTEKEVERAAKLGVAPSMTIGHVNFWGEVFHNHILGEDRAKRLDPAGSLEKNEVRFSFHSDSPVSPYNPLQYISTGASRLWQKPPQEVLGPEQKIAVDRAIRAVTLDAAYAMFFDDKVGSLEVGKYADLVELDANPRSTDPAKIPQIKVMATWVEGKPAYTGGKAAEKSGS